MEYADSERTFVIEENVADVADVPMQVVEQLLLRGMFPEPVMKEPRVWRVQAIRRWRCRVLNAAIGKRPGKKRGPYRAKKKGHQSAALPLSDQSMQSS